MKIERIENTKTKWIDVDNLELGKTYAAKKKGDTYNCNLLVSAMPNGVYILFSDELLPVANPKEYEYRLVVMVDVKYRFAYVAEQD